MRDPFTPFEQIMQAESLPQIAIDTFRYYYQQLLEGHSGHVREAGLAPVGELPAMASLTSEHVNQGNAVRDQVVMIKLNGGLGTSMGLQRAKSLIRVKGEFSFLEIIARHAQSKAVPLVLMNSFVTQEDSLAALSGYRDRIAGTIPSDFVQHKVPRISQADLSPVKHADNPGLEWCPPGHGDIYTAMLSSGVLDTLLDAGYRYAFISNADNLGAAIDDAILGYLVEAGLDFLMEVTTRTAADRKGGHLARTDDGRLILREAGQCHPDDSSAFQDVNKHRFFNTNNIWINLESLQATMQHRNNILGLPLIRNLKHLDAKNLQTPKVYQLETAMGAAIGVFERTAAIQVPRSRFAPVKTTNDLLIVRSDAYAMTDDYLLVPAVAEADLPSVTLDADYFRLIDDFESRFPHGVPSLLGCSEFHVQGDVRFGKNIQCRGQVTIKNMKPAQETIPDASHVGGKLHYS